MRRLLRWIMVKKYHQAKMTKTKRAREARAPSAHMATGPKG